MLEVESTGACAVRWPLPAACGANLGASAEARALGSHAIAHVFQLQGGCWVGLKLSTNNAVGHWTALRLSFSRAAKAGKGVAVSSLSLQLKQSGGIKGRDFRGS